MQYILISYKIKCNVKYHDTENNTGFIQCIKELTSNNIDYTSMITLIKFEVIEILMIVRSE